MLVNFIGRLGSDPESRVTPNGKELVNVSVAYDEKTPQGKETVWVKVTLSKMFAGLIPYLKKGMKVFISGKMNAPKISPKNGKVYIDVFAHAIEMLDKKEQEDEPAPF